VELDIPEVVGKRKVYQWRDKLMSVHPCVLPAWHNGDTLEEWYYLTKNYDYVATQGPKEGVKGKLLNYLLFTARENDCKVHVFLLGKSAHKYPLVYSCDVSSWIGARWGDLPIAKHGTLLVGKKVARRKMYHLVNTYNLCQWVKYAKSLESLHKSIERNIEK